MSQDLGSMRKPGTTPRTDPSPCGHWGKDALLPPLPFLTPSSAKKYPRIVVVENHCYEVWCGAFSPSKALDMCGPGSPERLRRKGRALGLRALFAHAQGRVPQRRVVITSGRSDARRNLSAWPHPQALQPCTIMHNLSPNATATSPQTSAGAPASHASCASSMQVPRDLPP